jgi:hypothetical protein
LRNTPDFGMRNAELKERKSKGIEELQH